MASEATTDIVPMCPKCHCVMHPVHWDTSRPRARCDNCHRMYYYSNGRIAMTAKIKELKSND